MNLKGLLKGKLTTEEMEFSPRSYETIGDIAILEIPEEVKGKSKIIAETLLEDKRNIRLVVDKGSDREGEFRTKKYKILAGEGGPITIHKENSCQFKLNINEVYFSSKESTERLRISEMVKEGENILVMGCGIGPFPIVIAKKNAVTVDGIDLNPSAIEYFKENIKLNKTRGTVNAFLGDAKSIGGKKYDRILITIPHKPLDFVETAAKLLNPGGVLHVYLIESQENDVLEELKEKLLKTDRKFDMKDVRKVLPYSPRIDKICAEIVIN